MVTSLVKKIVSRFIFQFPENLRVLWAMRRISRLGTSQIEDAYDVVVFSKDRPLQLKALIESYQYYCNEPVALNVVYSASSQEYLNAYEALFKSHKSVLARVENDKSGFRACLLSVLENLQSDKVFFLVDDILFKKRVSLESFMKFDREFVPSLRMGLHLKRSYTQSKEQSIPPFKEVGAGFFSWGYREGELDWGYPLSVDGHIFYRDEILVMTRALDFKAPNSYEAKLQKFSKLYERKTGICMEVSSILNIPCNKVQTENDNIAGDFHQDDLLKLFYEKKIDFKSYENLKNESCHQVVLLNLIPIRD